MSLVKTDTDAVIEGDLHLKGLTAIDLFAPNHVAPPMKLMANPIAVFPVYDVDRLVGWVPIYEASSLDGADTPV